MTALLYRDCGACGPLGAAGAGAGASGFFSESSNPPCGAAGAGAPGAVIGAGPVLMIELGPRW